MKITLVVKVLPPYLSWKGLIGSRKVQSILLHTRFGIHTFGVMHPIDVVILDKEGVVRKIKTNLQPNRIFFWSPLYSTVLELPVGTVKRKKIRVGTQISILQ